MTSASEWVGRVIGASWAPGIAAVAALRRSRMFHPRGVVYRAEVVALESGARQALATRLAGEAFVRLSSAWWKRLEWKDVLGIAIRFGAQPSAQTRDEDQDLLFATVRRPYTLALAPLTTEWRDFLANDYFAVSPFEVGGEQLEFRLRSERHSSANGKTRLERLEYAVADGNAVLFLEARSYRKAWDFPGQPWSVLCRITLRKKLEIDQTTLRFDPFQTGKGIRPIGAIHHLRLATYRASRWARALVHERVR